MLKQRMYVILLLALLVCGAVVPGEAVALAKAAQKSVVTKPETNLYGEVKSTTGKAVAGVVVSDGYNCTVTDKSGLYQLVRNPKAKYVFISTPSGYESVSQKDFGSYPSFYASAGKGREKCRVDFELTPLKKKSDKFVLVAIGDPQSNNDDHIVRFRDQTIPDVVRTVEKHGKYAVGIALGDVVGIGHNQSHSMQKAAMGSSGIPFYSTVGNHDKDSQDYTGEVYSDALGPLWYSFNVGDVHFLSMDNIFSFAEHKKGAAIKAGFSDEQLAWLKQDLSYVPKDKMVVLYYHIPERDAVSHKNHVAVFDLISQYANPICISGHTHSFQPFEYPKYGTYEYVLGAGCGYFWRSDCGVDGVPNGYAVFEFDGNKIANSYFKGTDHPEDYQIRMYRGDARFGENGKNFYNLGSDVVVANVFFGDMGGKWKIEVYEDGVLSGDMETMNPSVGDLWSRAYHAEIKNFSSASSAGPNHHQYMYKLKNPAAKVLVKATDIYGNVYTQDKFTGRDDLADIDGTFRNK